MGTPYAGIDEFAIDVPIPDDADEDKAAEFDPGYETALDRTTWIYNRLARAACMSWFPVVSHTHALTVAAWDPKGVQWYASDPGTNDILDTSNDQGATWSAAAPGAAGIKIQSIAVDASADVVATGTEVAIGLQCYEFNAGTVTWTTRTVTVAGNCTLAEVAWEPVHGLWAIYAWNDGLAPKKFQLFTSPDRATWTDQTAHLPAALIDSGGTSNQPRIGVGGGRIMVVNFYGGQFHASSCDGSDPTTWTAAASVTPFMATPTAVSDPLYSATLQRWIVCVTGTAVTTGSEIWASDDNGVTWTRIKSIGGTTFSWPMTIIRNFDRVVMGIRQTGAAAYSVDFGTTWYPAPKLGTAAATLRGLWAGDGRFLELDSGGGSNGAQISIATGDPNRWAMGT